MKCSHCGREGALLVTEDGRAWHPLCVVEVRKRAGRIEAKPKQPKLNLQEVKSDGRK